jgi:hypothetical protein
MLGYFLVVSVAFGFAYLIAGTGKALWRAIAGVFLGLIVGWVGGTTVIALVLSAGELGHNSFPRIFGTSFWWALLGSGYGVYRARKKLKTVNASNGNASQKVTNAKNTTNDAYAAALAEIEEGRIDKGAWARAFAESGGDESKAKALYIKARAEAINSLPAWHDTQPRAEDSPISRDEPGSTTNLPASKPTGLYESALGEKNLGYYLAKFQAFDEMGPGLHASWNWPAFFFTGFWALYRKMYGWFVAWVFILTFFGMAGRATLNSQEGAVWVGVANLAVVLGFAAIANSLYHAKIKSRIDSARQVASDAAQVNRRLSSSAGVNAWVTYTFGWIPVLGIVLAVALPAYQDYTKRQAVAAAPVQAPSPLETPGNFGENDRVVAPLTTTGMSPLPTAAPADANLPSQGTYTVELEQAFDAVDREIGNAYNYRMLPNVAEIERRFPVFRTEAGKLALAGLKVRIDQKLEVFSQPPPSKAEMAAAKNYEMQERAKAARELADLEAVSARAVREFPYLDTPEGKPVLDKIVARRNELIQEGTSPALALTRAVNQYAAAYAPQPPEKRATVVVPVKPPQNQGTDASGCRWVTPQQWSCN